MSRTLPYVSMKALAAFAVFAFLFAIFHEPVRAINAMSIYGDCSTQHCTNIRAYTLNGWAYGAALLLPFGYAMKVLVVSRW